MWCVVAVFRQWRFRVSGRWFVRVGYCVSLPLVEMASIKGIVMVCCRVNDDVAIECGV